MHSWHEAHICNFCAAPCGDGPMGARGLDHKRVSGMRREALNLPFPLEEFQRRLCSSNIAKQVPIALLARWAVGEYSYHGNGLGGRIRITIEDALQRYGRACTTGAESTKSATPCLANAHASMFMEVCCCSVLLDINEQRLKTKLRELGATT